MDMLIISVVDVNAELIKDVVIPLCPKSVVKI